MTDLIARLVALLQGLDGAHYSCLCGRRLRVGLSHELWEVACRLKASVDVEAKLTPEETSRFSLLEVDK
jgi:hypothetical protein